MYTKTKQQFRAFTNFWYLYFVIKVAFKLNYMKFTEIILSFQCLEIEYRKRSLKPDLYDSALTMKQEMY